IEGAVEEYRYMYRHLGNPNPPSSIFDQYQLSSELGRGAFASVRRAIGIMDGNTYAVKVIQQKRLGVTQQHARMFAREIEILRSLDHPNIVRCFGVYSDPTTIYIVMEYVGGGDLLDVVLKSGSGLEEQEAKGLTRDICIAMEYLHDHAIVHRDIKPENVLITTDSPRRAKIADFGLAKIIDSVTFLRTQCGTPAYLAPEVLDSAATLANGGYTPAVDVWSVGVMVFSMLTMTMPFGDEDEQIPVRERLRTRNANWEAMDNNSHDAQDWVRGMLAKEAPERMTMRDALNHRWLLDPYGDYSFAVPGNATPRSATPTGPRGGFGGGHRGFGGARNGNAPGPSLQGGGGGGGVQESSSVFIYGARALEQENRAPVETGVSSLGLGRMALDSVVVVDPPAKPAPAKAAPVKLGRKRPATTSMEQVVQSPVKKRAAV
ncbi:Pkinase-domain-containing protein, partial [Auricularia subglabra TFB-10046 SS5]